MWYFPDFNILIRKIILNKFQFQPQFVLNLFLFFWAISASVLLSLFWLKKNVSGMIRLDQSLARMYFLRFWLQTPKIYAFKVISYSYFLSSRVLAKAIGESYFDKFCMSGII